MHQQHARHIAILSDIEEAAYGYGLDDGKALPTSKETISEHRPDRTHSDARTLTLRGE